MSYTLLGSLRSPFVRIPRLFMMANNIPFQMDIANYLENADDRARVAQESPINKVPVLTLENGQKIFDSRVIMNYLAKTHNTPALSLDDENNLSAIYSALDVSVNLFMLKFAGLDLDKEKNWYVDRQKARIPATLDFLLPRARSFDPDKKSDWNYLSMALYSYLFWTQARSMLSLEAYPDLTQFLERFANAPFVAETDFTKA